MLDVLVLVFTRSLCVVLYGSPSQCLCTDPLFFFLISPSFYITLMTLRPSPRLALSIPPFLSALANIICYHTMLTGYHGTSTTNNNHTPTHHLSTSYPIDTGQTNAYHK